MTAFTDLAPLPVPSLAEVLAPVTVKEFRRNYLGRKFGLFPGERGRFARLFPWHDLNVILRSHRLDPPRIRLSDLNLSNASFLRYATGAQGARIARIDPAELQRLLQEGATLVIDAVDEITPAVRAFSDHLERQFETSVQANLYTGWRQSQGFGSHWDAHDVLVLQIHGRKRWTIYGVSRPFPLEGDGEPESNIPRPPAWEGVLESGDALYIPRGWWHDAASTGEPTLHLTFGLNPDTAYDYLQWVLNKLREEEVVRRDLSHSVSKAQSRRRVEQLKEVVLRALEGNSPEDFLAERDLFAPVRIYSSLPASAHPEKYPLSGRDWVRAIYTREPVRDRSAKDGTEQVRLLGREWRLPSAVAAMLTVMRDGRPRRVGDMIEAGDFGLAEPLLLPILSEFVSQGVLEVVDAWWNPQESAV